MRIIQILILLLSQFFFSQENKLKVNLSNFEFAKTEITFINKTCESGTKDAITDFNNGIYNYFTYGWSTSINNIEKNRKTRIQKYLKTKYLINYEHKGCIVSDESECYSNKMIQLIEEKFGKGFLEEKIEEANKKFKKNKIVAQHLKFPDKCTTTMKSILF